MNWYEMESARQHCLELLNSFELQIDGQDASELMDIECYYARMLNSIFWFDYQWN